MYYIRFIEHEDGKYYQSAITRFSEEKQAIKYYQEAVKDWQEVTPLSDEFPNTTEEDVPGIVLHDGTRILKYWNITKSKAARYGSHNATVLQDEQGRFL